jgi:hypothetical protein
VCDRNIAENAPSNQNDEESEEAYDDGGYGRHLATEDRKQGFLALSVLNIAGAE